MASRIIKHSALALAAGLALTGAKPKKPPPPPPPPAPVLLPIPPRPYPPNFAPLTYALPPLGADGLYESPNRKISPAQVLWNLRSGFNVAALNCPEPARTEIITLYKLFLRSHAKALGTANKGVDAQFRATYGAKFVAQREKYMTGVYNHFAYPPTLPDFCKAALVTMREAKIIKPAEIQPFANRTLPSLEIVFDDFNKRYAQFKLDRADWDAKYYAEYQKRYGVPPP